MDAFVGSHPTSSICAYTVTYESPRQAQLESHPRNYESFIAMLAQKKALGVLARRCSNCYNPRTMESGSASLHCISSKWCYLLYFLLVKFA